MTRPRIGIVGEGFVGKSVCRRFPPGEVAKYMENSFYAV